MLKRHLSTKFYLPLLFSFFFTSAHAVEVSGNENELLFNSLPAKARYVQVTGPNGFVEQTSNGKVSSATALIDGQYRFQVYVESGSNPSSNQYKASLDNGRDNQQAKGPVIEPSYTGYFRLVNGKVSQADKSE